MTCLKGWTVFDSHDVSSELTLSLVHAGSRIPFGTTHTDVNRHPLRQWYSDKNKFCPGMSVKMQENEMQEKVPRIAPRCICLRYSLYCLIFVDDFY